MTQVSVGLDFAIALGQDFDEQGLPFSQGKPSREEQSERFAKKEAAPFDYSGYQRIEKDYSSQPFKP